MITNAHHLIRLSAPILGKDIRGAGDGEADECLVGLNPLVDRRVLMADGGRQVGLRIIAAIFRASL